MIRIGVRAHDFGTHTAAESAARIAPSGAVCIQLALSKALSGNPLAPAELGPGGAAAVADAYRSRGIGIAVLGCYINPVHPDPEAREASLRRFEAHLRAAADFGCPVVGTETGSRNADCSFHGETASEETFRDLVASVRRLADCAEAQGNVVVGVEAVAAVHTVGTAAAMERLLAETGSASVGVIFDPTNLTPPAGHRSQDEFLDECISRFGSRIVAVHAKDYRIVEGCCGPRKSPSLRPGTGVADWPGLFRRLRRIGLTDLPVLIEDTNPQDAPEAIAYLTRAWIDSGR